MSGTADGGTATHRAGPRVWAGVAVGVVLVAGALLAVAYERDDGPVGGGGGPSTALSESTHEFEAAYTGDVWIEVDAPDDAVRTVTITWGAWRRRVIHETGDAAVYAFRKIDAQAEGEVVPTHVRVEPAAEVTFGAGELPDGAIDVNEDWVEVGLGE